MARRLRPELSEALSEPAGKQAVDSYIAAAPRDAQPLLRQLRKTIKAAAPDAVERISYGMPHYEHKGRLVYFAAFKTHIGLYPAGYADKYPEMKRYMAGAGTLRFPLGEPLPVALIGKLVKARVKENEAKKTR
ncbi:MAG: DUF1801 domain-containing protein [Chloroflexi bacterium]|nr:MAG: DUF1801 domain-containing protein [Chloroflexota bacterium]TME04238.1 MAG: DUF1801 domain-containing protein [Chloroflexota bacterium]TME41577.1 MAG: DUF1801 domain-containing protein [Chloroflexota bacterium]TME51827.1 MAG: DUF1801 domain-containing protein [Chloroflexota bacterium]